MKDVARVELGAQSYSNLGLVDGKPSAVIVISQQPDANIINLSKAVHAKVDELNDRMTNGIKIITIKDDADYIHESMKEVEFTILFDRCNRCINYLLVLRRRNGNTGSLCNNSGIFNRYFCSIEGSRDVN